MPQTLAPVRIPARPRADSHPASLPVERSERPRRRAMRALAFLLTLGALVLPVEAAFALGSLPGGKATYGSAIGADALNNTVIGGRDRQKVAYRFRATTTSHLESIHIYVMTGSGYSAGSRGTLRITVRPSLAKRGHIPSSRVLASRTVQRPSFAAGIDYRFPSPPRLVKGRIYHVVFENIDRAPHVNYVSVNGLFTFDRQPTGQPAFRDRDWAFLVRSGSGGWRGDRAGRTTPIMTLRYANGHHSGLGYMEVWVGDAVRIDAQRSVRQVFTIHGRTRRVSAVAVRLKRLAGEGPLLVRLLRGDDLVASGRIPASRIGRSSLRERGGATWATLGLPRRVRLIKGQRYRLVLSSPVGTQYSIVAIRQGGSYGYHRASYFDDGRAEREVSGGWRPLDGWGRPSVEADLQFYFR